MFQQINPLIFLSFLVQLGFYFLGCVAFVKYLRKP